MQAGGKGANAAVVRRGNPIHLFDEKITNKYTGWCWSSRSKSIIEFELPQILGIVSDG